MDEINQYIVEQEPKTDAVKEINDMRTEQFQEWPEAFDLQLEALEKAQGASVDEEADGFNREI